MMKMKSKLILFWAVRALTFQWIFSQVKILDMITTINDNEMSNLEPVIRYKATSRTNEVSILEPVRYKRTSSMDDSLVIARALGTTTKARAASILSKDHLTKISIVISHCESPVDWVSSFMGKGNFQVQEITILSKCEKEVDGLTSLEASFGVSVNVERLPNVGRCDHAYAHWISENYTKTKEELRGRVDKNDAPEDLILFLKDNNYDRDTYRPFPHILATALDAGFGCVQDIRYDLFLDCHESDCRSRDGDALDGISRPQGPYNVSHFALEVHYKPYIEQFSIPQYNRLERDKYSAFKGKKYRSLGKWKDALGLVFPNSEYINVCYGGNFLVQKRGMLSQSLDAWKNMERSLSRGNNIEEGHFAERSWASIVAPPLHDLPWDVVTQKVKPFATYWLNNVFGSHGRVYMSKESFLYDGLVQQSLTMKSIDSTLTQFDNEDGTEKT